ncbi:cytochrome b-c1 complex subunit 10 [Dipodascopsis uninucleata]
MAIQYKYTPNFLGFTPKIVGRWTPVLAVWGGIVGVGAVYLLEPVPRVQNVILANIPVIGKYWIRSSDPNDTPF